MAEHSFIRPDELWSDLGARSGQTVAHLGCGPGFYLIPAAKIVGETGKCIGIDIQAHLLGEVENRATRQGVSQIVQTVRADLENDQGSTLSPATVDWVLVANILHQSNPAKILREAARVVKPEGRVVVIEWTVGASPFGPPNAVRIAKPDALAAAEQAGLNLLREFKPSPYHYGLILGVRKS
jgi:ubiquinone/menaquinone biosynthesis C-methylase UbiE